MNKHTVSEKIMGIIKTNEGKVDEICAPEELTQPGLANLLGRARAHMAMELSKMRDRGEVVAIQRRVQGHRCRMTVYVSCGNVNATRGKVSCTNDDLIKEIRATNRKLDIVIASLSSPSSNKRA